MYTKLQQHLPFTVLKLKEFYTSQKMVIYKLQQHLPFTVLKPGDCHRTLFKKIVATALTVYGIET